MHFELAMHWSLGEMGIRTSINELIMEETNPDIRYASVYILGIFYDKGLYYCRPLRNCNSMINWQP